MIAARESLNLFDSGTPTSMWILAEKAAVHTHNKTPHKPIDFEFHIKKLPPRERGHFGKIERYECVADVHIPKPKGKFMSRPFKSIFMGYSWDNQLISMCCGIPHREISVFRTM